MPYAPFEPLSEPKPVVSKQQPVVQLPQPRRTQAEKDPSIEVLIQSLGPTARKLSSDILNGCSYWYLPNTNAMVEISGFTKTMRKPNFEIESYIRQRNNLPPMSS